MEQIIKKGTKVMWSGAWDSEPEQEVTIEDISQGEYEGDKEGYPIDEVAFDDRLTCTFDLDNGHWCYGYQIHSIVSQPDDEEQECEEEPQEEMEVRITFRSEVYIKGKTMDEIKSKWEDLPIFSADALEDAYAEFIEVCSAERVDDDSYDDVNI